VGAVVFVGWIGIAAACVVLIAGLLTLLSEMLFRARWKWGDAHKLKRSAKLGWNTGTPPEGAMFLVLEYADQLAKHADFISEHRWAVMTRQGDECRSINGGLTTPVTNVTGWLEITT
jgi:hypothetical protein